MYVRFSGIFRRRPPTDDLSVFKGGRGAPRAGLCGSDTIGKRVDVVDDSHSSLPRFKNHDRHRSGLPTCIIFSIVYNTRIGQ